MPKIAEIIILRKAVVSYVLIILSWIKLEKVILVRSEILILLVKFVSSKAEVETLS